MNEPTNIPKKNLLDVAKIRARIADAQQVVFESILQPPKQLQKAKKEPLAAGLMVQITASNKELSPGSKTNPPLAKGEYGVIAGVVKYLGEEGIYVYSITPADSIKYEEDITMDLRENQFVLVDMAAFKAKGDKLVKVVK